MPAAALDFDLSAAVDRSDAAIRSEFNSLISHIYRVGLMIRRRHGGVASDSYQGLDQVTNELDMAIRRLQLVAHKSLCQDAELVHLIETPRA
jgi:hypothetical protein